MACVFRGGSAEPDWFGCNSDNRPPLCFTPHNSLINAVHPKIAPLQHEIELNHLDTICNWLEMSKTRGNIINNLEDFSKKLWIKWFLFILCFIWPIMHFIILLGGIRMSHVRYQCWISSFFLWCVFHLDRCLCRCSLQAKFRCMFHCCWLLWTKSAATDH